MSIYNFDIKGKINTDTKDSAIDIITLILEDNNITIKNLEIYDSNGMVTEI